MNYYFIIFKHFEIFKHNKKDRGSNLSICENQDPVGVHDCVEPVGDSEHGAVLEPSTG